MSRQSLLRCQNLLTDEAISPTIVERGCSIFEAVMYRIVNGTIYYLSQKKGGDTPGDIE
jgi:hypothetical protein